MRRLPPIWYVTAAISFWSMPAQTVFHLPRGSAALFLLTSALLLPLEWLFWKRKGIDRSADLPIRNLSAVLSGAAMGCLMAAMVVQRPLLWAICVKWGAAAIFLVAFLIRIQRRMEAQEKREEVFLAKLSNLSTEEMEAELDLLMEKIDVQVRLLRRHSVIANIVLIGAAVLVASLLLRARIH